MIVNKRLLFVDDEPRVLVGLERSLRSMRSEWTMEFASSGDEALLAMEKQPFDVIVTDMRMPGMNGAELLHEVRRRSPQTVRMALSGHCDRETILSAVQATHQYIAKPCDASRLKEMINQAFSLRTQLETSILIRLVSQLRSIPSLPGAYQAMMAEMSEAQPRLDKLAALISSDMGMSAKCLQLVNSAFFGMTHTVSSTMQAINLLGLDTLKSLILSSHIFSEFKSELLDAKEIGWLWEHSFAVSACARRIAEAEGCSGLAIDEAATAGLLHAVGKVVLASCLPREYRQILDLVAAAKIPLAEAETELLGCSHAEVGAYLLGLWGLPDRIVEAVAFHLNPLHAHSMKFSALTAVHVACVFHCGLMPSRLSAANSVNGTYLEQIGLSAREPVWFAACARGLPRSGEA